MTDQEKIVTRFTLLSQMFKKEKPTFSKRLLECVYEEDQAPIKCEKDILVYLWAMKYGHSPVELERIAEDGFMCLAAVRLAQENKLKYLAWKEPGKVVIAEPLTRFENFEGLQLNADS